jgi:gluconokinase
MAVVVVMGVCGSGKSTLGRLLQDSTHGKFFDGDDFHPLENIQKMKSGVPLDDADREGWLASLCDLIRSRAVMEDEATYIACSALKKKYRQMLFSAAPQQVHFVFLDGSQELLRQRMAERVNHFMPPALVDSQLSILERPSDALTLDISNSPQALCEEVISHFHLRRRDAASAF